MKSIDLIFEVASEIADQFLEPCIFLSEDVAGTAVLISAIGVVGTSFWPRGKNLDLSVVLVFAIVMVVAVISIHGSVGVYTGLLIPYTALIVCIRLAEGVG